MPDWLDPKAPTLPRFLRAAGYRTAQFGKWHLTNRQTKGAPLPEAYGYDVASVFNGGEGWPSAGLHDAAKDTVAFIQADYPMNFKVSKTRMEGLEIERHEVCTAWNCTISPRGMQLLN